MSTQTLSSVQPPPTPNPDPDPDPTSQNVFSPSSSPPLILAFLAIGLFSTAMIFIFWRRIQVNRSWRMSAAHANRSYFELPIVGADIPKLWDLSNAGIFSHDRDEKGGAGSEVDVRWLKLMPLSLSKKVLHSAASNGSIQPRQHPLNDFLHTISNPLSRRRASLPRHNNDDGNKANDDATQVTMQVAITIALPSPQYPIHIRNRKGEGKNTDRENMTDYCIGMYECPWP